MSLQAAGASAWMLPEAGPRALTAAVLLLEEGWASLTGLTVMETALPAVAEGMLRISAFHSLREMGLEPTGKARAQVRAVEEEE